MCRSLASCSRQRRPRYRANFRQCAQLAPVLAVCNCSAGACTCRILKFYDMVQLRATISAKFSFSEASSSILRSVQFLAMQQLAVGALCNSAARCSYQQQSRQCGSFRQVADAQHLAASEKVKATSSGLGSMQLCSSVALPTKLHTAEAAAGCY